MSQVVEMDVRDAVLNGGPLDFSRVRELESAINGDYSLYTALRDVCTELESVESPTAADNTKLGVCLFLLGKPAQAKPRLIDGDGSALAKYYLGRANTELSDFSEAQECFDAAVASGASNDICSVAKSESQRLSGSPSAALKTLDSLSGAVEQTADYLCQRAATVAEIGGNPGEVVALYERAVTVDGQHPLALTGLAMENDRRGNDGEALRLYERAAAVNPVHVGSLLNLGLMYEDRDEIEKARSCYRRILDTFPNDARARLFMRDVVASGDMYYDEDAERRRDRLSQVLSTPVSDFELSVRSRNCLEKMGIGTLGDLVRCTEHELLASKNFGETSLTEIREMLTSRGLRLGQLADDRVVEAEPAWEPSYSSPDEQAVYERPIADLNLSVRARKCMVRLGITTIGELLRRTGDDLLECKNFGVTSLNEVREKLSTFGWKLRGD